MLDRIVSELNDVLRSGMMDLHLRMGRAIVFGLYEGDLRIWRSHGSKETSFKKLAARTERDLHVSATSLYRSVALFEMTDRLGISTWKRLGVSHLRTVLGLRDPDQRRLLTAAEESHWTVERLESEVSKLRVPEERRRGRHPLPILVKTVRRVAKAVSQSKQAFASGEALEKLSDDDLVELHGVTQHVMEQLDLLKRRLVGVIQRNAQR
jgi:hypothetical protein